MCYSLFNRDKSGFPGRMGGWKLLARAVAESACVEYGVWLPLARNRHL